jgi:hypothetical protein
MLMASVHVQRSTWLHALHFCSSVNLLLQFWRSSEDLYVQMYNTAEMQHCSSENLYMTAALQFCLVAILRCFSAEMFHHSSASILRRCSMSVMIDQPLQRFRAEVLQHVSAGSQQRYSAGALQ